jgi:two-component system, NarL family, sensor histidine kinase UhpB
MGNDHHPAAMHDVSVTRPTLFQRLFFVYAAVLVLAAVALIFAPVTVSVPIAIREIVVILAGLAAMLLIYRMLLRHALTPLERLTVAMRDVDPLAPGQRVAMARDDAEVAALAEAFNDMLDRLEGERRDSGRRALAAQEDERRRVARELHDEIGQLLTGIVLRSETLSRRAPDDMRSDLEELREAARAAAEEVRVIARRLRPEALDELGLQSALLALCTGVRKRAGIEVERHFDRDLALSSEQEVVIYRVAQEALTNIVRHSGAKHASVLLAGRDDRVVLEVRDDGVGVPADADRTSTGIRGMRERALLVGADFEIRRVEPHGTLVRLEVPRP